MLKDLVTQTRSIRRFEESAPVARETLRELVDLARLSASGGNLQPLKFLLSADPERNARIFPHLSWAGYIADWAGPAEGERPAAYIVILGDTEIRATFGCDHGIAAQSIVLGAREKGLGACMIGSIERDALRAALAIPANCEILLVVALGRPAEHVVLQDAAPPRGIKYWRDAEGVHHVPKRSLNEIILD
jgi:nitroreductase